MIEIFSDRMEITNPGLPLIKTDRFLDSLPRSRNEALASFMRRYIYVRNEVLELIKMFFRLSYTNCRPGVAPVKPDQVLYPKTVFKNCLGDIIFSPL